MVLLISLYTNLHQKAREYFVSICCFNDSRTNPKINPSALRSKDRSLLRVDPERPLIPALKSGVWARSKDQFVLAWVNYIRKKSIRIPPQICAGTLAIPKSKDILPLYAPLERLRYEGHTKTSKSIALDSAPCRPGRGQRPNKDDVRIFILGT